MGSVISIFDLCSIIGFVGNIQAAPLIVKGLKCMEYRGYDSVGVATYSNNKIHVRKGSGKVSEVNNAIQLERLDGTVGIGHTRWATHGQATSINAHPHESTSGKIAIVHNGIIDNYVELKKELESLNYIFKSDTDSEIIANLLDYYYNETREIKSSIIQTVTKLKGNYSFVAVFEDGTISAAKFHEPLIIGVGKDGYFVSSDVLGFIEKTAEVIYPDNKEFVIIKHNGLELFDFEGKPTHHQITTVSKEFADVYKGEYAHFTLKEIYEQPTTILRTGARSNNEIQKLGAQILESKNVYFTGSGTSYNACLIAKQLLSQYAKLKIETLISSETEFSSPNFDSKSLLIALSQSGESADVLDTANKAIEQGSNVFSIVNMTTSSLANMSQTSIGLNCGPEIGVAATKSFTSQLVVLYKLIEVLCKGSITINLDEVSQKISEILSDHEIIKKIARDLKGISDIYVLGRGIHFPIALEASLKLKELTYIHAEGIPGGELKHGPLALMDHNVFVIILNPSDSTYKNTLASIHEIKARGAKVIGISDIHSELYDYWIKIPHIEEHLFPIIEILPLQILSYYSAIEKNADPDYPRNLAKSVTVK